MPRGQDSSFPADGWFSFNGQMLKGTDFNDTLLFDEDFIFIALPQTFDG